MKATPRWAEPPTELVRYRQANAEDVAAPGAEAAAVWERFRATEAYLATLFALIKAQHGLCAYCEQALVWQHDEIVRAAKKGRVPGEVGERVVLDSQVEHVRAKSGGAGRALDPTNLIACCNGGTQRHLVDFPERFLRPSSESTSCGQAKDDVELPFDTRDLPCSPPLLRFGIDGDVYANAAGCAAAGLAEADVNAAINEVLHLNCARLITARKARYKAAKGHLEMLKVLVEDLRADDRLLRAYLESTVAAVLALDAHGHLRPFWSVWREVFSPFSEDWILANQPDLNLSRSAAP